MNLYFDWNVSIIAAVVPLLFGIQSKSMGYMELLDQHISRTNEHEAS